MPIDTERMTRIEDSLVRIEKLLERHEKLVFGNGTDGCATRIKILERTAQDNKENILKLFHATGGIKRTVWIAVGFTMAVNFIFNNDWILKILNAK